MNEAPVSPDPRQGPLSERAGLPDMESVSDVHDEAWVDVIHTMDRLYADLVSKQIELESKNAALEEAHRFIESILHAMTDILIVCDTEGRILQVNRALEELTGLPATELRGRHVSSLFSDESIERLGHFYSLATAEDVSDCEVSMVDRNGDAAPLAMNCSSQYDHKGRLIGKVLIGRAVGELRRAYQQLSEAHQKLKRTQRQLVQTEKMASLGRLVAGVAHELNNPIGFVYSNVHMLKRYGDRMLSYFAAVEGGMSPEDRSRLRDELRLERVVADFGPLIEGTLEGAQRVSDIVKDLRRYSASREEAVTTFDVTEVIRTAVQWVVKACRRKPEVVFDLPDRMLMAGYKGPIHQILVNLVQNAVDVMQDISEPVIEIGVASRNGRTVINVRDHGPGIPSGELQRVFDPFYTTKPVGQGTGLGLYISYGLAEDLGGCLKVGNHPQGGAVFSLEIPTGDCSRE